MSWAKSRSKSVQKHVTFTPEEWADIEQQLSKVRQFTSISWNGFARFAIKRVPIVEVVLPFDPQQVTKEINKIGVNVNQIAHRVNEQDHATLEDVRETRELVGKVREQLAACWKLYDEARR